MVAGVSKVNGLAAYIFIYHSLVYTSRGDDIESSVWSWSCCSSGSNDSIILVAVDVAVAVVVLHKEQKSEIIELSDLNL